MLAQDTEGARNAVVNADDASMMQLNQAKVNAALEVAALQCRQSYANIPMQQLVMPLVVSSGGTLHKDCYHLFKDIIVNGKRRRQLLIDISVALTRARAQAYDMHCIV